MVRKQHTKATGGANAEVTTGTDPIPCEGLDSILAYVSAAGGAANTWSVVAVLDDSTEVTIASGTLAAGASTWSASIGRGVSGGIALPLPKRIKFKAQGAGGGAVTLLVITCREQD